MARKPDDRTFWEEERQFFARQITLGPRDRMGGFESYATMQAHFALLDGFPEIGQDIASLAGVRFDEESLANFKRRIGR